MEKFCVQFGYYEIDHVSVDNLLEFMNQFTEGRNPQTKRVRFTSL
jgi:hypothetical protein